MAPFSDETRPLIWQDRLGTNVSGTLRKEAFPQGESEQAIASGSLLYCHFEEEAWSEAMHHYMLEAGDNAAVDGWWTDFGGAPGGVPVPGFNGNAEWQCSHDSHPIGKTKQGFIVDVLYTK